MESIYEAALAQELGLRKLRYQRQAHLPITYKGARLGLDARIDLIVEGALVVELKAIDRLAGIHRAQHLTYLRLTGLPVGLLINFNVDVLRNGVRRILNG